MYYHDCTGCSQCSVSNYTDHPQVEHCRLFGLPDLNQSMPIVRDTLVEWIYDMIPKYGFDGMRLDTVPYITPEAIEISSDT